MRAKGQATRAAFSGVLLLSASAGPAYAYLDAGTGSMMLQLLLGGFAGALVVGRVYWARLKGLFQRRTPTANPQSDAPRDAVD